MKNVRKGHLDGEGNHMEMNKEAVIEELRTRDEIYFANAAATNHPFVVCDEESFNDQVWIFPTEDDLKAYFEKYRELKIRLLGKRCEKKNFGNFYRQLRTIGVNSIVWAPGEDSIEIELDEIAPEPELSAEEAAKKPPINPSLQLSAIYFMQEMRRPITLEEHKKNNMRALEEEMLVNICKSSYFMLLRQDPEDPKKMGPVFIQTKDKKLFQPLFSDVMELARFGGQKQPNIRVVRIPFVKLKELMHAQATGVTFNPGGFNLTLTKEQILKLIG
jgi:hypothetical protein